MICHGLQPNYSHWIRGPGLSHLATGKSQHAATQPLDKTALPPTATVWALGYCLIRPLMQTPWMQHRTLQLHWIRGPGIRPH
ncbi:hypothetical protein AVEN_35486-1 [Araneus ventricosus]|uniref:Uncharacterized protein n=1 Tax=Araneus ventricosus TaxID=182803 RepID=A0A4Y2RD08_ARAVE|nr:hypothetical protein AVEN_35486-1 [Araneus ventricosus]